MSATKESVGVVGLRNTATKNKLTDTVVPLWELEATNGNIPAAESFNAVNPGAESVIGGDERVRVPKEHFAPGGKYRSIVKIFLRYENQKPGARWPIATGWLIRPDLLVTAGHCAFDWGHNMGRLVQAKCYIGYNGQTSLNDPAAKVQFRQGKRVATTLEWLTAKGNRAFDAGFILLEKPFEGITPFKFEDTPLEGSLPLGVVGYPGDLKDPATNEPGAHMYEMFLPTRFNLAESQWRMLEYEMDTYGGNSGSPVLREHDHVAIGVHVYGGAPNSASVIGLYGNPFLDYVAAFDLHGHKVQLPGHQSTPGVQYITVPTKKTPDVIKEPVDLTSGKFSHFTVEGGFAQTGFKHTVSHTNGSNGYSNGHHAGYSHASESHTNGNARLKTMELTRQSQTERPMGGRGNRLPREVQYHTMDEEGFFDVLKQSIKIGGPILKNVISTVGPFALGPLGGPVAALAGVAISAAGKLAETGGTESDFGPGTGQIPSGLAERAILAEAAFVAMTKMDNTTLAEEGFFDDMWQVARKVLPVVKQVAPKVLDVVAKPALAIAIDALGKGSHTEGFFDGPGGQGIETVSRRPHKFASDVYETTGPEAFMLRLEHASQGEEGLFDDIGSIFSKAIKVAGPVLTTVAKHGLPLLQGALAEADVGEDASPPPALAGMNGLHERAVLAEAALQAAMKAPQHVLEEEGFFDFMASAVKKIAPVVLKAAPAVISGVSPVVGGMLKSVLGAESGMLDAGGHGRGLRKQASAVSLRGERKGFGKNADLWKSMQSVRAQGEEGFFNGPSTR